MVHVETVFDQLGIRGGGALNNAYACDLCACVYMCVFMDISDYLVDSPIQLTSASVNIVFILTSASQCVIDNIWTAKADI